MPKSHENQITLEKSKYFEISTAPKRIKEFNKDMKLLLIVRNPVEVIISHYKHLLEISAPEVKDTKFEDMVLDKTGKLSEDSNLVKVGIYINKLKRFRKDPVTELSKVETFLNIPHKITLDMFYYHKVKKVYCIKNENKNKCFPENEDKLENGFDDSLIRKLRIFYRPYNVIFFETILNIRH